MNISVFIRYNHTLKLTGRIGIIPKVSRLDIAVRFLCEMFYRDHSLGLQFRLDFLFRNIMQVVIPFKQYTLALIKTTVDFTDNWYFS